MKSARLDKILEDLGYVTEKEIRVALERQRKRGGRLGSNLIELGFLTPEQLMRALSRQYGLPWRPLAPADVPVELRHRIPPPGPHGSLAVPVRWDAKSRELVVAVNDPEDLQTLESLRASFDAAQLVIELAPDHNLRAIHDAWGRPHAEPAPAVIELPELFAPADEDDDQAAGAPQARGGSPEAPPRILMITARAHHRTFLPTVFAREGRELVVADGPEEVAAALEAGDIEAILLDAERADAFRSWVRSGRLTGLPAQIATFPSVSDALLANPVPYEEMIRSLRAAVEALADARTRGSEPAPPYGILARDAVALAQLDGLSRLAVDGLHLAVHLLVPPAPAGAAPGSTTPLPFADFSRSREIAVRLRFPWPIEKVLDACFAFFLRARTQDMVGKLDPEIVQAARILALVWYYRILAPVREPEAAKDPAALRNALRRAATRLATLELAEKYLGIIEEREAASERGLAAQVLLVGGERIADLGARLSRSGIRPVVTRDLDDALAMAERRPPEAVVVDQDAVPGHVDHFARVAKLNAAFLLYVVTDAADPAVMLGLLDAGFDDVFAPPHDFDVTAAKIVRAIASRSRVRSAAPQPTGRDFSATFSVFSFLDLAQALGHSRKSVRIELRRTSTGEEARLYLDQGRPVHATCGPLVGAEAVYRVISWEDDGEFTVYPETEFPEPTINDSLEGLIMEGCRLLDEATR